MCINLWGQSQEYINADCWYVSDTGLGTHSDSWKQKSRISLIADHLCVWATDLGQLPREGPWPSTSLSSLQEASNSPTLGSPGFYSLRCSLSAINSNILTIYITKYIVIYLLPPPMFSLLSPLGLSLKSIFFFWFAWILPMHQSSTQVLPPQNQGRHL